MSFVRSSSSSLAGALNSSASNGTSENSSAASSGQEQEANLMPSLAGTSSPLTPGYTQEEADRDATTLYIASDTSWLKLNAHKDEIFAVLERGRTSGDIALIDKGMHDGYQINLLDRLQPLFASDDDGWLRCQALLQGVDHPTAPSRAQAAQLHQLIQTNRANNAVSFIRHLLPVQRQALTQSFFDLYAAKLNARSDQNGATLIVEMMKAARIVTGANKGGTQQKPTFDAKQLQESEALFLQADYLAQAASDKPQIDSGVIQRGRQANITLADFASERLHKSIHHKHFFGLLGDDKLDIETVRDVTENQDEAFLALIQTRYVEKYGSNFAGELGDINAVSTRDEGNEVALLLHPAQMPKMSPNEAMATVTAALNTAEQAAQLAAQKKLIQYSKDLATQQQWQSRIIATQLRQNTKDLKVLRTQLEGLDAAQIGLLNTVDPTLKQDILASQQNHPYDKKEIELLLTRPPAGDTKEIQWQQQYDQERLLRGLRDHDKDLVLNALRRMEKPAIDLAAATYRKNELEKLALQRSMGQPTPIPIPSSTNIQAAGQNGTALQQSQSLPSAPDPNLRAALCDMLDGREEHEALLLYDQGALIPHADMTSEQQQKLLEEALARQKNLAQYEGDSSISMWLQGLGRLNWKATNDVERLQQSIDKLQRALNTNEFAAAARELGWSEDFLHVLGNTKNLAGDWATQIGATIAIIGAMVVVGAVTGGTGDAALAWYWLMLIGAGAGAAGGGGGYYLTNAQAGETKVTQEALLSALSGATGSSLSKGGLAALSAGGKAALKENIKIGMVSGAVVDGARTLTEPGAFEEDPSQLILQILSNAFKGALSGGIIGGGFHLAGQGVGSVYRATRNRANSPKIHNSVKDDSIHSKREPINTISSKETHTPEKISHEAITTNGTVLKLIPGEAKSQHSATTDLPSKTAPLRTFDSSATSVGNEVQNDLPPLALSSSIINSSFTQRMQDRARQISREHAQRLMRWFNTIYHLIQYRNNTHFIEVVGTGQKRALPSRRQIADAPDLPPGESQVIPLHSKPDFTPPNVTAQPLIVNGTPLDDIPPPITRTAATNRYTVQDRAPIEILASVPHARPAQESRVGRRKNTKAGANTPATPHGNPGKVTAPVIPAHVVKDLLFTTSNAPRIRLYAQRLSTETIEEAEARIKTHLMAELSLSARQINKWWHRWQIAVMPDEVYDQVAALRAAHPSSQISDLAATAEHDQNAIHVLTFNENELICSARFCAHQNLSQMPSGSLLQSKLADIHDVTPQQENKYVELGRLAFKQDLDRDERTPFVTALDQGRLFAIEDLVPQAQIITITNSQRGEHFIQNYNFNRVDDSRWSVLQKRNLGFRRLQNQVLLMRRAGGIYLYVSEEAQLSTIDQLSNTLKKAYQSFRQRQLAQETNDNSALSSELSSTIAADAPNLRPSAQLKPGVPTFAVRIPKINRYEVVHASNIARHWGKFWEWLAPINASETLFFNRLDERTIKLLHQLEEEGNCAPIIAPDGIQFANVGDFVLTNSRWTWLVKKENLNYRLVEQDMLSGEAIKIPSIVLVTKSAENGEIQVKYSESDHYTFPPEELAEFNQDYRLLTPTTQQISTENSSALVLANSTIMQTEGRPTRTSFRKAAKGRKNHKDLNYLIIPPHPRPKLALRGYLPALEHINQQNKDIELGLPFEEIQPGSTYAFVLAHLWSQGYRPQLDNLRRWVKVTQAHSIQAESTNGIEPKAHSRPQIPVTAAEILYRANLKIPEGALVEDFPHLMLQGWDLDQKEVEKLCVALRITEYSYEHFGTYDFAEDSISGMVNKTKRHVVVRLGCSHLTYEHAEKVAQWMYLNDADGGWLPGFFDAEKVGAFITDADGTIMKPSAEQKIRLHKTYDSEQDKLKDKARFDKERRALGDAFYADPIWRARIKTDFQDISEAAFHTAAETYFSGLLPGIEEILKYFPNAFKVFASAAPETALDHAVLQLGMHGKAGNEMQFKRRKTKRGGYEDERVFDSAGRLVMPEDKQLYGNRFNRAVAKIGRFTVTLGDGKNDGGLLASVGPHSDNPTGISFAVGDIFTPPDATAAYSATYVSRIVGSVGILAYFKHPALANFKPVHPKLVPSLSDIEFFYPELGRPEIISLQADNFRRDGFHVPPPEFTAMISQFDGPSIKDRDIRPYTDLQMRRAKRRKK